MLQNALAWLSSPPPADPRHDLAPLRQYLKAIVEAALDATQRLTLIELFQPRVDSVFSELKPALLEASLPLPLKIRSTAPLLLDIHGLAASAILKSIREMAPAELASPGSEVPKFCGQAMSNLSRQQQIALFMATGTPSGLWVQVQEVLSILGQVAGADASHVEKVLKVMLAMAAVQPESFTARDLGVLADYLSNYSPAIEVARQPKGPLENWYWIEDGRDLPPVAVARRPPPNRGSLLFYSCANLSRIVSQHLLQLLVGESGENPLLPMADAETCREVLAQAQKYWSRAPLRLSHRRPTHYRVRSSAGFPALWKLLWEEPVADAAGVSSATAEWMVLNESPGGYALMHVTGPVTGLVPGEILGLWIGDDRPWSVGLIRWVRSENPEHLELGLEMIAPSAAPVRIVQTASGAAELVPALLFPSVSGLDRDETLMTARGMAETGAYLVIREADGKLQLTQCDLQHMTLQTAKVEVFEFRRNFAPG